MSEHIKDLGRFFGADQVGIAQLGPGGDTEYSFAIVIMIRTEDDPRTSQGIGGQAAALTGEYVSFNLAAAIREFGFRATRSGQADGHRLAVCAGLGQEINARFFEDNKPAAEPLTTDQAKAIVSAVVRYAEDAGYAIAVAVVDGAGEHIESSAMAGAATDLAALALNKAYSAAKLQVATHQLGRGAATPSFQEPPGFQHERLVEVGGGYPAFQGDAVVGAVGVAGSPSPQIDLLCCQAGLAAIGMGTH